MHVFVKCFSEKSFEKSKFFSGKHPIRNRAAPSVFFGG
nr:MAG TPA: hypothetical protein [Caudoviricetes sp.]